MKYTKTIGCWDVFEAVLKGTSEGNPFTEQHVYGVFSSTKESVQTEGFYDGDGIYRIRFMPSYPGTYTFILKTTFDDKTYTGTFFVKEPQKKNHGPVRVHGTYHFAYEDGTLYKSVGTTAYVWELQSREQQKQTLTSLVEAGFNKIRFCIFPKHYVYNFKDPEVFPYVGTPMDASVLTKDNFLDYFQKKEGNNFDYTRFNPEYFRRLERNIYELGLYGIEADLIVMHPYDRWGFSSMTREEDELYWRYVINRFSAFHNVWWSLANEWDLMFSKTAEDFELYGNLLVKRDPYHHLRSIHNCREMYDHSKPWITHCSIQRVDLYKGAELTNELREKYQKPVVMDEIAYEGNIPFGWGNITAEEMVRRFYETVMRGGYPGHGETYLNEKDVIWWSHGGQLHGESWKRVKFLWNLMNDVPGTGLACIPLEWDSVCAVSEEEKDKEDRDFYMFYYSFMRPSSREFNFNADIAYSVDVIDTWNMTIENVGVYSGKFTIELPQQQYMMIRLQKVDVDPNEAGPADVPVKEFSREEKENKSDDSTWVDDLDVLEAQEVKASSPEVLPKAEEEEDFEEESDEAEELVEVEDSDEENLTEEETAEEMDEDESEEEDPVIVNVDLEDAEIESFGEEGDEIEDLFDDEDEYAEDESDSLVEEDEEEIPEEKPVKKKKPLSLFPIGRGKEK